MNIGVSVISFSICLLLIYRQNIDFYNLVLYATTLLNLFIFPARFLVEFLGSFKYNIR